MAAALPGMTLAMSAQRLPASWCAVMSSVSSASDHAPRLMSARRWLCHRSPGAYTRPLFSST